MGTGTKKPTSPGHALKYSKFGNIRTEGFHSKGEFDCFKMLQLLERAGEIAEIQCQVQTKLVGGINHKTDFKYFELKRNIYVWGEYKGFEDQRWRDIRKLWKQFGPGPLQVFKGRGYRIYMDEEIVPKHE